MWIFANAERFTPQNFVIIDFYGEERCFAWQNRNLVVFPYGSVSQANSTTTPKLPVIVAPRDIKSIRGSGAGDGRVFVVCKPMGIYKLNQALKFCVFSQTGVGMAALFYQVLSVENQWLHIKDKSSKSTRELFQVQETSDNEICVFVLDSNSDLHLRRAFHQLEDDSDGDVCIIANGKNVFVVTSKDVQLIYHCDNEIRDIVGILKAETIAGFVLVAENSAILVYVNDANPVFDKVFLDSKVHRLCAGIDETSDDLIWIAHVDKNNIYYSSKTIGTDTFRRIRTESGKLLAIANYKNKTLVGLSENKQLLEIEIQNVGLGKTDSEEFHNLKPEMLNGTDRIMDEICERAKELQLLNELLLEEQEKLKRINIYAHKQAIFYLPNVKVERFAGRVFLRVTFGNALPINCHVVVSIQSAFRTTYSMKLVTDSDVVVDIPVDNMCLDTSMQLNIDLVTMANESRPWCLIRNYVKNPTTETKPISRERARFLRAKLAELRNLSLSGNLTMEKLSELKRSMRREL